jgi:diphosphomevalonate decarboxylase
MADNKSQGYIEWSSPSNIAAIKYWGKTDDQRPLNPSLSFTLKNSKTITGIKFKKSISKQPTLKVIYDKNRNLAFETRIRNYLDKLNKDLPFIQNYDLEINTRNTFPHSTGIASSASAFSALALCLYSIENTLEKQEDLIRVSHLARLGSGSASRSLYPIAALWGKIEQETDSSDEYAIDYSKKIHPIFKNLQNTILIINDEEKSVSSSKGHQVMKDNPYASTRYSEARKNLDQLLKALKEGDFQTYAEILEHEALTLHALMMTSKPGYILMKPNTLQAINYINDFKRITNLPITYTMDAGPNIHLQYPKIHTEQIKSFIITKLTTLCKDGKIIFDEVGQGPQRIV